MNEADTQIRQDHRLQRSLNNSTNEQNNDNSTELIQQIMAIPDEGFIQSLHTLKKYYLLSHEFDVECDGQIMSRLISFFSFELPFVIFISISDVLICLIYKYQHSLRQFTVLREFLKKSIQFLQSDISELKLQILIIISSITSFSERLSVSTFRIVHFQYFCNIIIESIEFVHLNDIYVNIIQNSSRIIFNVFHAAKKLYKDRIYPDDFINSFFGIIKDIFTSHPNFPYIDLLFCAEEILNSNGDYAIKFQEYDLIPHLNHTITLSESPSIQIVTLGIFNLLLKNSVQTDSIDILHVYNLMLSEQSELRNASFSVLEMFLAKNPEGCDVFFELGIIQQIEAVLDISSFKDNLKILSIIMTLLKNSAPQNQFVIVQSHTIITFLIRLTCNVEEPLVLAIFRILEALTQIAAANSYNEMNNVLLDKDNVAIIEENAVKNAPLGEVAQSMLKYLNELTSKK